MMDGIAVSRRKNLEGQFDLFGGEGKVGPHRPTGACPIFRSLPPELMTMEKEVTGLYLSGTSYGRIPGRARTFHAVPIGSILADFSREDGPEVYQDGQ
jgi:DNA polymerase-3 subunit alpha